MANVRPIENEGQTEDEKPASAKPSNDIKPEEATKYTLMKLIDPPHPNCQMTLKTPILRKLELL